MPFCHYLWQTMGTYRTLTEAETQDLGGRILFEDNHLLVINKRSGEIVQGDLTGDECLTDTYKAYIAARDGKPGRVFLGLPHRLDRPVCGITVLAKTSKALERLSAMFRDGNVSKTYLALVCGIPASDEALLENYLWRDGTRNKTFIAKSGTKDAKLARLKYRTAWKGERYALLEVELLTGRHHQIRCQLAAIGHPIKGDLKYGAPRSNPDGGICLQSHRIRFPHPVGGAMTEITAPWPDGWKGIPRP